MSEEIDTRVLDKFIKALKGDLPIVRVGILGGGSRKKGDNTNAAIGAKHELGADGMPVRSFLRIPIAENLEKYLEKSGAFDKDTLNSVVKQASIVPWMKKLAVLSEQIVQEGFDSGGFGKWKPSDMRYKKNQQTLVETQQLRNSITAEVK